MTYVLQLWCRCGAAVVQHGMHPRVPSSIFEHSSRYIVCSGSRDPGDPCGSSSISSCSLSWVRQPVSGDWFWLCRVQYPALACLWLRVSGEAVQKASLRLWSLTGSREIGLRCGNNNTHTNTHTNTNTNTNTYTQQLPNQYQYKYQHEHSNPKLILYEYYEVLRILN